MSSTSSAVRRCSASTRASRWSARRPTPLNTRPLTKAIPRAICCRQEAAVSKGSALVPDLTLLSKALPMIPADSSLPPTLRTSFITLSLTASILASLRMALEDFNCSLALPSCRVASSTRPGLIIPSLAAERLNFKVSLASSRKRRADSS